LFRASFSHKLERESAKLVELGIPGDYIAKLEREHASSKADHSIRMWNLLVLAHWLSAGGVGN
jgi:hypothetical protein